MDAGPLGHRYGEVLVTVLGLDGRPLSHREVVVEQRSHAFAFGNIGFDLIGLANAETEPLPGVFGSAAPERTVRLAGQWLEVFNTATLPFYWSGFEPEPGRPDTVRLHRAATWFAERGCRVKGHPLLWHTLAPEWLREAPVDEIEATVRARIRREVTGFAGVISAWDAINEAVIMPVFANEPRPNAITRLARERGRVATVRLAFEEARAADPGATLLINDFDTSTAYEKLIEGVLEAGVRVDAIGLQSHMHQGYWGEQRTREVLDRFARFGLPLHMTETTLVSGELMPAEIEDLNDFQVPAWPSTPDGEQRQAEEVTRHYRSLLAHPAVQAITYWGLTDEGAWLGAPCGLVRADGTPKPAYDALKSLVKGEWWHAPATLRTDHAGRVEIRGMLGDYQLHHGGETAALTITTPGRAESTLRLGGAR